MSVIGAPIRKSAIPKRDLWRQSLRAMLKDNDTRTQAFDDTELDQYLDLGLSDMNVHPTFTYFNWIDVPDTWRFPVCLCAQIFALLAQGLIEKGREFEITDMGLTFNPPRLGDYMMTEAQALISMYAGQGGLKDTIKANIKPTPLCVGTYRILAINPYLIRLRHLREKRIY